MNAEHDYSKNSPNCWIVCAAIKLHDGTVICAPRHGGPLVATLLLRIGERSFSSKDEDQGFVDQFGNFHTREEAYIVAKRNGQIRREVSTGLKNKLFSEHLY